MIRLTCLALAVLLPLGCGGNGDDGGSDQRSNKYRSIDQHSTDQPADSASTDATPSKPPSEESWRYKAYQAFLTMPSKTVDVEYKEVALQIDIATVWDSQ